MMMMMSVSVRKQVATHWDCRNAVENATIAFVVSCELFAVIWDSATRLESPEKWTAQSWPR